MASSNFVGFPRDCVSFLEELAVNNNKAWFTQNKSRFNDSVMAPARDFVYEMDERLKEIAPRIHADPRIDKSIFRPYRDTRFSKDKSPYKVHLGIFLWEGARPKMDCPGFYFHLEPPNILLGVGIHCFSKPLMEAYREAAVDDAHGKSLKKAVEEVKQKGYDIGVKGYKRTPRGYDSAHPNADLLLHNGLTAAYASPIPDQLYSREIVDYCFERFEQMAPIEKWLLGMIDRMPE